MSEPQIGTWVSRLGGTVVNLRQITKPHYVESVIEGEAITHCGRRLRRIKGTIVTLTDPVYDICERCRLAPAFQATLPTANDVRGILRTVPG